MRRPALVAFALIAGACQPSGGDAIAVTGAWVRLPAVAGRPAAAYFMLRGGTAPDRLAAIDSPRAGRAELHQGGMSDGMMTMRPLNGVDIPVGRAVPFAPGGDHVMLYDVDPALKPGGTLPLRFRFQSGAERSVDAKLIAAGDAPPT